MNGETKYSVLLPVYIKDNPEWFRIAVDSMINQTLPPDEIVIAIDGPLTDELDEVIKQYEADRDLFSIYRYEVNEGLGSTLRKTVPLCRNEYIARMDADDYSLPERCEIQINYLNEHPEVGVVGSNISEFIDVMENVVSIRKVPEKHEEIVKFAKRRSPVNHPTLVYKKSDILKVGNYGQYKSAEDYEFVVRMLQGGIIFHNIDKILLNMRVSMDLHKRRGGIKHFKTMYHVQKSFLKTGFYPSKFHFIVGMTPYAISCLSPNKLRSLIYANLLRKKV